MVSSMNTQRPKVGVGVLIVKDGKVLLGKRKGAHGEGTWCPPGGHLEMGESWATCAARETREEAGIEISGTRLFNVSNDLIDADHHYVSIIMLAEWSWGSPRVCEPEKLLDWQWFDWDALPDPLFEPIEKLIRAGLHPCDTHHDKLVRDNIPQIIEENGDLAFTHIAEKAEYRQRLKAKLTEEVNEYLDSGDIEELADILEVIHSLTALDGLPREQLKLIQTKKRQERGGFEKRIVLDQTR